MAKKSWGGYFKGWKVPKNKTEAYFRLKEDDLKALDLINDTNKLGVTYPW